MPVYHNMKVEKLCIGNVETAWQMLDLNASDCRKINKEDNENGGL